MPDDAREEIDNLDDDEDDDALEPDELRRKIKEAKE